MKGLPGTFSRKKQLAKFVAQTLWVVVQHSVTNNPNGDYGSETAIYPTKLYDDPRAEQMKDVVYMLPGVITANVSYFANVLGIALTVKIRHLAHLTQVLSSVYIF